MLIEAIVRVQASLDEVLSLLPPQAVEQSRQAHRTVIAAILAGDPLAARAEMERLCDATASRCGTCCNDRRNARLIAETGLADRAVGQWPGSWAGSR